MKLGLDMHGVIDSDPIFFSDISRHLINGGHEVFIITGKEDGPILTKEILDCRMTYTSILSITTYHKQIGTYIKYKNGDPNRPLIAPPKWDRTKADFCRRLDIDIMIDDSKIYGRYFEDLRTQYILWTPELRRFLKQLIRVYIDKTYL